MPCVHKLAQDEHGGRYLACPVIRWEGERPWTTDFSTHVQRSMVHGPHAHTSADHGLAAAAGPGHGNRSLPAIGFVTRDVRVQVNTKSIIKEGY